VAARAEDMIGNAMPSVQMLSIARGDLRTLENDLERYADVLPVTRPGMRDDISSLRQNFEESLATYAALPFFPKEQQLYAFVERDRDELDRSIDAFLTAPDEQGLTHVRHLIDVVDAALQRLVSFDATQGETLGFQIQTVHSRAAVLAIFMDAVSVMLAVIASILALRQLRRTARARQAELSARDVREHELSEQNQALGDFAGRVAHDVLSPLGAVQLTFDFLRATGPLDPQSNRAVERGESAVRRVQTLVDGLLAFSRAGGHPDPDAHTPVAPVITDVMAELGAQAKQRQIQVSVSPIPDGAVACSDAVLTSIISNLVRNAIKHMAKSDPRRIDVRVSLSGSRWRFEVDDTGPGIPAEHQQRVFEPHVQLTPGSAGIVLGLATVDRLVRAHGGSLGLVSPPNGGAQFWFELPAYLAPTGVRAGDDRSRDGQRYRDADLVPNE